MALTKVTYSLIKGAVVNVFDFMSASEIASVQARDGSVDVSSALQAAIDSTQTTITDDWNGQLTALSGTVYLPEGDYYIKSPLIIANGYGLIIEGSGIGATGIFWDTNDNTKIAIQFSDCNQCQLRQLSINANENVDKLVQFYNNGATSTITSTSNTLQDVDLNGNYKTYACCIVGGGVDANNDFMHFVRVAAHGYNHSAFFLQGLQAHQNHFIDCNMVGIDSTQTLQHGLYGIFSQNQVIASAAASFIWERGSCGWHSGADFFMGAPNSTGCSILWGDSENSNRFFETSRLSSVSATPINIVECRMESDKINADGKIVNIGLSGPVSIRSCQIGTGGASSTVVPYIYIENTKQMLIDVSNNVFSYANLNTSQSSYDEPSLQYGNVSYEEYAQVQFAGNSFINAVKQTPNLFYQSKSQSTVPAYFGYGPYVFVNTSPQNVSTLTPCYPWQKILLIVNDGNTTFVSGGNISLKNKSMPYTPGSTAQFELIYNPIYGWWEEANAET